MRADLAAIWPFSRAPLAWAVALLALNAGIALIEPVIVDPYPPCDDWLWCPEDLAVGVVFDRTPDFHVYMLAAIPAPFLAFAAARFAAARPGLAAHWFMVPPLLALLATIVCCFIWRFPLLFFFDITNSYAPAIIVLLLKIGILLGTLAALASAVLTLLCTLVWRLARSGLRPLRQ